MILLGQIIFCEIEYPLGRMPSENGRDSPTAAMTIDSSDGVPVRELVPKWSDVTRHPSLPVLLC